jgi:hypothetical protein
MSVNILHSDSFDLYDTALIPGYNDLLVNGGANWQIQAGAGRRGTNALQFPSGNGPGFYVGKVFLSTATTISVGFAYSAAAFDLSGGNGALWALGSGSPTYPTLLFFCATSGGALGVYNYNGTFQFATPTGFLEANVYHHYEFVITVSTDPTVGQVAFYKDNALVYTTPNFRTQADISPSVVYFGAPNSAPQGVAHGLYDDLFIADNAGGADLPIGDTKVLIALPSGPGHETQWAVTGESANWQATGQNPSLGDTAYVSSETVGQKDTYALSALASSYTEIIAVAAKAYMRKEDAGNRQVGLGVSDGTTDAIDSGHSLGTQYGLVERVMNQNPITSSDWATGDIAGLQAAIELTV